MARTGRSTAYVLLVLTLLPWVFWIGLVATLSQNPPDAAAFEGQMSQLPLWMWAMLLVMALTLGLIVVYIIHLYTKSGLSGLPRGLWLASLVFGNLFAMPFYWLVFVWLPRRTETPPPPADVSSGSIPSDTRLPAVPTLGNTAGELLDASVVLTRRNYWTILRTAVPALILAFALEALLDLLEASSGLPGLVLSLIPWSLVDALAIAGCWSLLHGAPCTFPDSWRMVSPRLGAVVTSYGMKWLAISLGLVLLIIPGFVAIVRFFALPMACVTEQASFGSALSRSLTLSKGRFKLLAGSIGFVEILTIAAPMLIPLLLPGGSWQNPSQWSTFTASLIYVIALPFRAALFATVYLSLRVNKEGYDLSISLGNLARAV